MGLGQPFMCFLPNNLIFIHFFPSQFWSHPPHSQSFQSKLHLHLTVIFLLIILHLQQGISTSSPFWSPNFWPLTLFPPVFPPFLLISLVICHIFTAFCTTKFPWPLSIYTLYNYTNLCISVQYIFSILWEGKSSMILPVFFLPKICYILRGL